MTTIGLDDLGTSMTLESNKSLEGDDQQYPGVNLLPGKKHDNDNTMEE